MSIDYQQAVVIFAINSP